MGYVLSAILVIGLAALALWGTGGVAFLVLMPLVRALPIVSAILATIAVVIITQRLGAGPGPAIAFGLASIAFAISELAPMIPAMTRWRPIGYVVWSAPLLTLVSALALWHLARESGARR
jgi:hypothetical protein